MLEINIKAKNNRPKNIEIGVFIPITDAHWHHWGCEEGKIVNGWNGKQYMYTIKEGVKGYVQVA